MIFVSASQIGTYRDCARKWGFQYILGQKTPQHPAAALGTEIDDNQLQPYLRDGRMFDYTKPSGSGYMAASILAYLPQPKTPGMVIQKYFELPSYSKGEDGPLFGFRGYMDMYLPKGNVLPGLEDSPYPAVVDFKSTSNFRWAKTPETLATDVQAQLYATQAMFETGARTIDLAWLYMQTKGPRKAKKVHLRVHADHVAKQFSAINDTALEMYELRKSVTNPLDLRPNAEMCDAYGGCPFRSQCNLSPDQIIESIAAKHSRLFTKEKETNTMSGTVNLLASLKARKNGGSAAPTTAAVAELIAAAVAAVAPVAAPVQAPAPVEVVASPAIEVLAINPPESELPIQVLEAVFTPAPPAAEKKAVKNRPRAGKDSEAAATNAVATQADGNPVAEALLAIAKAIAALSETFAAQAK